MEVLPKVESVELDGLRLIVVKDRSFGQIVDIMKKLQSIKNAFQADKTTVSDVRNLLDHVIDSFPTTSGRFYPTAGTVHNPDFGSGVLKVKLGEQSALGRSERLALTGIERNCSLLLREDEYELSFAEQAINRQRRH